MRSRDAAWNSKHSVHLVDLIPRRRHATARLLVFDPDKEGNDTAATARVLEKIKLLESDDAAQELWFSQPSVLPSANEWLTDWCRNASDLFRAALLRKGHRVWPTLKADGVPNP